MCMSKCYYYHKGIWNIYALVIYLIFVKLWFWTTSIKQVIQNAFFCHSMLHVFAGVLWEIGFKQWNTSKWNWHTNWQISHKYLFTKIPPRPRTHRWCLLTCTWCTSWGVIKTRHIFEIQRISKTPEWFTHKLEFLVQCWNHVGTILTQRMSFRHDDVIKWKLFSALLAICAGNSPVLVNSPHKGQGRGALMFSLIYVWINGWVNNHEAGDLRRYCVHYDVIVMAQV